MSLGTLLSSHLHQTTSPMEKDQETQTPENPFDPRRLILRWLISTLSIFAAVWMVPGIQFEGPGWQLGIVALFFSLLHTLLRPLLVLLTIFTLGLFGLLVNALLLILSSSLADSLGILFHVDNFWSAFLGGIVISLVSLILSAMAGDQRIVIKVHEGKPD
jgi:putative membrane protein